MVYSYKQRFNRKYGQPLNQPNSIDDIAKLTGYKKSGLKTIFEKGESAFYNNPKSVRPNVKNPQQWAFSRVYAAVNPDSKAYEIDKIHLKKK